MRTVILLLFIWCPLWTHAQTLILNDGSRIEGTGGVTLVSDPDQVVLWIKGKAVFYPVNRVKGYFKSPSDPMRYLMLNSDLTSDKLEWEFAERFVEGEISLYRYFLGTSVPAGYGVAVTEYQLAGVKGDEYAVVCCATNATQPERLKRQVAEVKAMTSDVSGFDAIVDSAVARKWTSRTVVSLINRYNVARYKPAPSESSTPGVIVFFLKATGRASSVKVIVDDTKEFELSFKRQVSLVLPADQLKKVCLIAPGVQECMMVRATACCQKYYEVEQDDKDQSLEISHSDLQQAKFHFDRGQYYLSKQK